MLGELVLPIATSTDEAVHTWLVEVLMPLNLSPDFLGRVLKSAQESAGHAFQSNIEGTISHVHVLILAPCEHAPSGKSWGFFHIERIEASADNSAERHHAIDFYLYVEGE
jgi:hypothetical protein